MDRSDERISAILRVYEKWGKDSLPHRAIWKELSSFDQTEAVTLINFFRFHNLAAYSSSYSGDDTWVTRFEAFNRYAAVSGDCLTKAGGKFCLFLSPLASSLETMSTGTLLQSDPNVTTINMG